MRLQRQHKFVYCYNNSTQVYIMRCKWNTINKKALLKRYQMSKVHTLMYYYSLKSTVQLFVSLIKQEMYMGK